ncbi:MAG TPA: hypothetical protein VFJ97_16805 [Dermatophilaceae bacterium]|nr:hypothetical protein [Dermatophilaceae bacterium]
MLLLILLGWVTLSVLACAGLAVVLRGRAMLNPEHAEAAPHAAGRAGVARPAAARSAVTAGVRHHGGGLRHAA